MEVFTLLKQRQTWSKWRPDIRAKAVKTSKNDRPVGLSDPVKDPSKIKNVFVLKNKKNVF